MWPYEGDARPIFGDERCAFADDHTSVHSSHTRRVTEVCRRRRMPTIADFSLATLEKLLWSIGNADASVFDEVPTDTLVMASQQLKKAKTDDEDGPTLIIHLDLNKTILSVDEVKGYGREEVVYLEEFKGDADFLSWAQKKYGADAADADAWIADLKVSKHEPELIAHAKEYAKLNPERRRRGHVHPGAVHAGGRAHRRRQADAAGEALGREALRRRRRQLAAHLHRVAEQEGEAVGRLGARVLCRARDALARAAGRRVEGLT